MDIDLVSILVKYQIVIRSGEQDGSKLYQLILNIVN